ncbi:ATP-dependent DNA helicase RecG [Rhodovulum sulfidophilum]|uniref:Probable DNA 3'-5' helicase RecG n=1 Tax=Rhodovulum visakhapatnamense TaxID=364297 RepID=A0ABS1RE49_9RHOB|nr:ATP-dependent DNA helicase RecG [Rhodovulum visakhapatnamense]MBL3571089.1 ATP-dependent DNA helicase RecG [Rhodovulum visakhapatnamense]MBL3577774.1 ATP-dependent DNA helicase RecG [Rhodovulum visakhapatnamense]OLS44956.1 ATP-dependent DNA helicase RecG [Rhodovulum sulfidophilum]
MSGRPDILFPLFGALEKLDGIGPKSAKLLAQTGIEKPRDLIFTLPHTGIDRRPVETVASVAPGEVATVEVLVGAHMPASGKGRPYRIQVQDAETAFQLVFFHARGDYLSKILPEGARRVISGRVEIFDGMAQIVHPDHVLPPGEAAEIPDFEPVYPLTAGLTLKTMTKAVASALTRAPDLPDWIDPALLVREGWPGWRAALEAAHAPQSARDIAATAPARQRLAYDELLAHQLTLALARADQRRAKGRPSQGDGRLRRKVLAALPFRPTDAQARAMDEIAEDMGAEARMTRLLQGDVGSGKTLVAWMALLVAVEAGGQGVMMAPTEILARQHLESLAPLAESAGVVIEILTGRDKGRERAAKLAALAAGDIQVLVGTHAVFQKDVEFRDLRLAIVDEQHRFGVAQRVELSAKGRGVDMLVMTATPIPRSLALATYGDLDISVLDEKPPGRTPVKTALVSVERMEEVVAHLRKAVAERRQAYWVCPLVEESEVSDLTAAEERFKRLRAVFGDKVGLVHGQLPPAEKDAAMRAFQRGETSVLVATTVIEVGVNVPNASIMLIERAEGFGLAQLHQLRGRVGRGAAASTCLLMYQAPLGEAGRRRLEILRETEDGFRIAEEDLAMRGAGDLIGTAQSGLPRFRIADLERQAALMAVAQSDARKLLADDPGLAGPRGQAARVLLWLMERDKAIRLIKAG